MKIGFTGTHQGMTLVQKKSVTKILKNISVILEVHHGDCIGADEDFHNICVYLNIPIIIHPPIKDKARAFCKNYYQIREPKDYIVRNHDIVDETDLLIACPKGFKEELRSGTWTTVRYARKVKRRELIIYPYEIKRINASNLTWDDACHSCGQVICGCYD